MRASELCTRDVVVAARDESVIAAAKRMRDAHVGDLVVVDDVGGRRVPIGIITDRDIVVELVANGAERLAVARVGDAMTDTLISAHEEDDVADVLGRMTANGVRRIPLVDDDGCLTGVLSFDDVVALLAEELADLSHLVLRQQRRERQATRGLAS
jgi:CBS domain-containing protein